jgi:TPR repeat protein
MYRASGVRSVPFTCTVLAAFVCTGVSAWAQGVRGEAEATAIQHQATVDRIRVVVHLDRPVRFAAGTAVGPDRIFFDLQGTRPARTLASRTAVDDPLLLSIRVGQYQPGITRLVLDLDRPAPYSATFLSDPSRLVVEISRAAALAQTRSPVKPASGAPIKPKAGSRDSPAAISASTPNAQTPAGSLAPFDSKLVLRVGTPSGDPSTLLEAAQHGDPNAQFQMGELYMSGRGVEQDPAAAAEWYWAAADQGDAVAASNLGVLYANGWGVPQSDLEAAELFRKAADAGDAGGENNLGCMYLAGRGVPQSDALGAKAVFTAAEHGVPEAQYTLGTLYANGRGVPPDQAQAVKWLKSAAAQGYAPAQILMGKLYSAGTGVARDYVEAYSWFALAAASGDREAVAAMNSLAPRLSAEQLADAKQHAVAMTQPPN